MSRYEIKNKIRKDFAEFQSSTISLLSGINFVCLTADIWGTKHASYLGTTCHYLDPSILDRKSLALGCTRFHYPHTNENIAEEIQILCSKYGIDSGKIVATVTDNASNFIKAFREFGSTDMDECNNFTSIEDEDNSSSAEELHFPEVDKMSLSKHLRCASHTLNLIATMDSVRAQEIQPYSRIFISTFKKLNILWNKTQRPKSSETIREILHSGLGRPGQTRWNSMFMAINEILSKDKNKLDTLMLEFDIESLTCFERQFLQEYVDVMSPIAAALDN